MDVTSGGAESNFQTRTLVDEPGGTVLVVAGEIDMVSANEFFEALRAAQQDSVGPLVVDMCRVVFMDSSGINALTRARTLSPIKVLASPPVAGVLRITGLVEHLGVTAERIAEGRALLHVRFDVLEDHRKVLVLGLVLKNLEAILIAAGSSLELVLKVTVYISEMEFWPAVNSVYARFFGDSKPARAIVPVKDLHYGFKIEIDAIAATNTGHE